MKTNELSKNLGISKKDSEFILQLLANDILKDEPCKVAKYAGERYRDCTTNEDQFTIWANL